MDDIEIAMINRNPKPLQKEIISLKKELDDIEQVRGNMPFARGESEDKEANNILDQMKRQVEERISLLERGLKAISTLEENKKFSP